MNGIPSHPVLTDLPCALCGDVSAREVMPARLQHAAFTPYTYSARRNRRVEHYRIVACTRCGLLRSSPALAEQTAAGLYAASTACSTGEIPYMRATYGELLRRLPRPAGRPATYVEIGCGSGFMLEEARACGYTTVAGFEPARSAADQAAPAVRSCIQSVPFTAATAPVADVVAMFQVLDHLYRPLAVLRDIRRTLRPGGRVLIVCHDAEAWSTKLLGHYSPVFDIEHVYLFTRKTLTRMLTTAGFRTECCAPLPTTYALRYWVRMLPGWHRLAALLPAPLARLPLTIPAGNLYAVAAPVAAGP